MRALRPALPMLLLLLIPACGRAPADAPEASAGGPPEAAAAPAASVVARPVVHVWKDPSCGCCAGWVEHMRASGYTVEVEEVSASDLQRMKDEMGVPRALTSCHTARVGDYVVEGHVPAEAIDRLLAEHPAVEGLAVPGMPVGSPGMEVPGQPAEHYDVVAFGADGSRSVFEKR